MIGLHRLPLIEQKTLDEWAQFDLSCVGFAGGGLLRTLQKRRDLVGQI